MESTVYASFITLCRSGFALRDQSVQCYRVPDPMDAIAGMPERQPLPAGAVAVLAPWPAAGPALAILQLLLGPANAAFSGRLLLGVLDPADELVARQGRDVLPGLKCGGVDDQRLAQVCG